MHGPTMSGRKSGLANVDFSIHPVGDFVDAPELHAKLLLLFTGLTLHGIRDGDGLLLRLACGNLFLDVGLERSGGLRFLERHVLSVTH